MPKLFHAMISSVTLHSSWWAIALRQLHTQALATLVPLEFFVCAQYLYVFHSSGLSLLLFTAVEHVADVFLITEAEPVQG